MNWANTLATCDLRLSARGADDVPVRPAGTTRGVGSYGRPPSHTRQPFSSPSFTTLIRSVAALKSIVSRFFVIANAIPVAVSPYA